MLLALFVALSSNTFAQINLPEGATQRIDNGEIWEIAYSPDGKYLAVASSIGTRLCDARTGAELNLLTGYSYAATSIAFIPDNQTLAIGGAWCGKIVRLRDMVTEPHKMTLDGGLSDSSAVAYGPDGRSGG